MTSHSGGFQYKKLYSWAFYDFANTIFSAVVLTAYFPLYVTALSGQNFHFGLAATLAMLLAGIATPFLGALSDQTGKTKKYLFRTTTVTIGLLFSLSCTTNIFLLFVLFISACVFYHSSLVFYNSLLPCAATSDKQGWASGLGTGLGYFGVVCTLPIVHAVDQTWGKSPVFGISAVFFALAAIPLFINVPERSVVNPKTFRWKLWKEEGKRIVKILKVAPKHTAFFLFLGGNFFLSDALNSMIFWFMVYAKEVFNPSPSSLVSLLAGVNAAAFIWGILSGYLTDKAGAFRVLSIASFILAGTLFILSKTTSFEIFCLFSVTGGAFALSAAWTAGRKAVLEFAPEGWSGSFFGLYGLTTKISVLGILFFSIAADLTGFRSALWLLTFPAGVSFLALTAGCLLQKKDARVNPE